MNRQAKKNIESIFMIGLLISVFLVALGMAWIPNVRWQNGGGIFINISNTSTVEFYNFTINFTTGMADGNITQVNITLPANFTLAICEDCNGTSALQHYTFVNTSGSSTVGPVLSWTNASGILVNSSVNASFWFNATATTAGWFNATLAVRNVTAGAASPFTQFYNLSIRINDTTPPIVNVTSGASVPAGENFSMLKSGMNYSGNVTIRITAKEDTPVTMIFRVLNNTIPFGEQVNLTGNLSDITASGSEGYWYRRLNTSVYSIANRSDVTYNITIWLNDTSSTGLTGSNINNTVSFTNIRFDNLPPIIMDTNISAPTAGGNYSQIVTFNITGYDRTGIIGFWNATNTSAINSSNATFETTSSDGKKMLATFNTTSIQDGYYNFYFIANDTAGNNNHTRSSSPKVTNVVIDNTKPTVTLTRSSSSTKNSLVVSIAVTDWPSNISGSCTEDQGDYGSVSGSGAGTQTFTRTTLNCGTSTTVAITCNDYAGNYRTTSITASTDACTGGSSSSGGGGGGGTTTTSWANTYPSDNKELSELGPVTKKLSSSSRVKLKVGGETHYVGVTSLTTSTATIEVSSTPQSATLTVGEERMFDINGDGSYYDLSARLNSIGGNKADITIKSINVAIPTTETAEEEVQAGETAGGETGLSPETTSGGLGAGGWIVIIIVLVIVLGLVIYFVVSKYR